MCLLNQSPFQFSHGKTASTEALITQESFKVEEPNLLSVLFLSLLGTAVEVDSNLKDLTQI